MLINLTPHTIRIMDGDLLLEIASSGNARVQSAPETVGTIGPGLPLVRVVYGEVTGLPAEDEGCAGCGSSEPNAFCEACHSGHVVPARYIVSRAVAAACPDRRDLLVPYDLVRDASGQILGCRALEVVS